MLPHHVEVSTDDDGFPAVAVTFDLAPEQAAAAAHAVRTIREVRYRTFDMSADDVVAMREMTSLADELAELSARGGADHVRANIARLGALRSALEEFAANEHLEREGDAAARPIVFLLADAVADLHAEALRALLPPAPVA
ncbi:MAG TPA: hypothetical protein VM266_01380 [Solirubrobacteraceae bacterium]|nr:hypothetical protein [Solirubrobacteraceae bacterium]